MRAVWIFLLAGLLPAMALAQGAAESALAEGEALMTEA
jgi:Tfp pilus assembly protein PilX